MNFGLIAGMLLLSAGLSSALAAQDKAAADTNKITPATVISLKASLPDLLVSPDRAWLYFVNAAEEKVQRVDLAKRELDAATAVDTGKGDLRMFPSADGKTIYVLAATPFTSPANAKSLSTRITVIDPTMGKVRASFTLPVRLTALCSGTRGLLFATGTDGMRTQGFVVDPSKKAIVNHWIKMSGSGSLFLSADQKKAYFDGTFVGFVPLPSNPLKEDTGEFAFNQLFPRGGRMAMSPDGQFLFSGAGPVAQLAKGTAEDIKGFVDLGLHTALAVDPASKIVFVATSEGFLKMLSYPDFEVQRSWNIGTQVYQLAFDSSRKLLVAATDNGKALDLNARPIGSGDLQIYDLTSLIDIPKK